MGGGGLAKHTLVKPALHKGFRKKSLSRGAGRAVTGMFKTAL
jgi:hypothetical protein